MKNVIFLICLFFITSNSSGQTNIDSLIRKIDNTNAFGTCHYVWVFVIATEAGESLIRIGEPASNKLIELLDKPDKGIIAHIILSNIYLEEVSVDYSWSLDKKDSVEYIYSGLKFYEGRNGVFARQEDLDNNKKQWLLRIDQKALPLKKRIRKKRARSLKQDRLRA